MAKVKDYSYVKIGKVARRTRINSAGPKISDVENAFADIRTRGDFMGLWDGNLIPKHRYSLKYETLLNHFQGLQRLRKGKYLVISGAEPGDEDKIARMSQLFIVRMGSRSPKGGWKSNVVQDVIPPEEDTMVGVVGIDSEMWHPGGLSSLGDILAVPIYGKKAGKLNCEIVFFHTIDPEKPKRFDVKIKRTGVKAGAVAMTRVPSGHYVVAVWSDSDKKPRRLDFYLSRSADFHDGFDEKKVFTWNAETVKVRNGQDKNFGNFQCVNFVNQADGRLYLIGTHNNFKGSPVSNLGKDYADLFEITFSVDILTNPNFDPNSIDPKKIRATVTKVDNKHCYCKDVFSRLWQCNMNAASGIYLDHNGLLHLYSSYHWRQGHILRFNEFSQSPPSGLPEIQTKSDSWIELFEDSRFKGRRLGLRSGLGTDLENYFRIHVQGEQFDDQVSSVRFQLPKGKKYRLYENKKFNKVPGKTLDLVGTGHVEEIENLKKQKDSSGKKRAFGDKVSSSKYV